MLALTGAHHEMIQAQWKGEEGGDGGDLIEGVEADCPGSQSAEMQSWTAGQFIIY